MSIFDKFLSELDEYLSNNRSENGESDEYESVESVSDGYQTDDQEDLDLSNEYNNIKKLIGNKKICDVTIEDKELLTKIFDVNKYLTDKYWSEEYKICQDKINRLNDTNTIAIRFIKLFDYHKLYTLTQLINLFDYKGDDCQIYLRHMNELVNSPKKKDSKTGEELIKSISLETTINEFIDLIYNSPFYAKLEEGI